MRTGLIPDRDLDRRQYLDWNLPGDRGLMRDLGRNLVRNRGVVRVLAPDRWQIPDSGMVWGLASELGAREACACIRYGE